MERIKIEEQELIDKKDGDVVVILEPTTKKNTTYIVVGDELCPVDSKAYEYCYGLIIKYREERDLLIEIVETIIHPYVTAEEVIEKIKGRK